MTGLIVTYVYFEYLRRYTPRSVIFVFNISLYTTKAFAILHFTTYRLYHFIFKHIFILCHILFFTSSKPSPPETIGTSQREVFTKINPNFSVGVRYNLLKYLSFYNSITCPSFGSTSLRTKPISFFDM
jgi:hypothetical protein